MEELKFTKEIKSKWLDALKSGDYKQGTVRLRREGGNTYCCLGVLADIHPDIHFENDYSDNIVNQNRDFIGYKPFIELFGKRDMESLYEKNDSILCGNYDHVIPLIEALPTVD